MEMSASLLPVERSDISRALSLTFNPHPLSALDRQVHAAPWQAGRSVRAHLLAAGFDADREIVIRVDGVLLTVDEWDTVCPDPGMVINAEGVVSNGGGNGGSNPVAAILTIALMIYAPYLLVTYGGAAFGTISATTGVVGLTGLGTAAYGAVMMAGSMLINAVFRPSLPSAASQVTGALKAESPTYSLSGGSNRMRPYEPLAVLMGSHRIFPDYAAKPYSEYDGDDQILYQAFNFGIGNLTLTDLRIGETSLDDYADVVVTRAVNGVLPGFFGNVDSTPGGALANVSGSNPATNWVTRTSGTAAVRLAIDLEGTFYSANNSGGLDSRSATLEVEYRPTGSGAWLPFDPAASPNGTQTLVLSGASSKPLRRTLSREVAAGQYDVRIRRLTPDETDAKNQSTVGWSVMRTYQQGTADYSGQTVLGVRIKASGQLNGSLQQLSALGVAQAPAWTGSAWADSATQNPAWWYLNFCRGVRSAAGVLLYGCGLTDGQIDIEAIKAWATFCDANGLHFSAVLDRQQTAADVLAMIARCGFASPTWSSGKLGVVWDAPNQSPVMAFGMSNICKGSFEVAYLTDNVADEVIVNYANRNNNWQQDQVRVTVPGTVGTPARPVTLDLMGCTTATMAAKFANAMAAQQLYRRRQITWETDFEGFVCTRGDVVLLSHDLTQWGYSGRLVAVSGSTITLNRTVPRNVIGDTLMLQAPDGSTQQFTLAGGSGETDTLILPSAPTLPAGAPAVDMQWFFSPLATPGKKVKITSVQPVSASRVRLMATDEFTEYYAAWNGAFTEPAQRTLLPANNAGVRNLTLRLHQFVRESTMINRITASWSQTGGTDYAQVSAWLDDVLVDRWPVVRGAAIDIDLTATAGTLAVEVVPVAATGNGAPSRATIALSALPAPAMPVLTVTPALFAVGLRWTFGDTRQDIRGSEIWCATTNNRSAATLLTSVAFPAAQFDHRFVDRMTTYYYWVKVIDTRGNASAWYPSSSTGGIAGTLSADPAPLLDQLQGALTASQLAASLATPIEQVPGLISTVQTQAGTITTIQSSLTGGGNLFPNSGFTTDIDGWALGGESVPGDDDGTLLRDLSAPDWCPTGMHTVGYARAGTPVGYRDITYVKMIPVEPGARYCASGYLAAHRCSATVAVLYLDGAMAQIANSIHSPIATLTGGASLSNWDRRFVFSVAPANARYIKFMVRQYAATGVGPYTWLCRPMLERATVAQTQPSPWSESANSPASEVRVVADKFTIAAAATNPAASDGAPFFYLTVPTVINGVTVPAGAYMKSAYIHTAAIGNAQIAELAVTNSKFSGHLQSNGYAPGNAGWKIDKDGAVEFGSGTFRGTIYASAGVFNGTVSAASVQAALGGAANYEYSTPGSYSLTIPTGLDATTVRIRMIGGSGGGGGSGSSDGNAYGGAGGSGAAGSVVEYNLTYASVAGSVVSITVGAGGSDGVGGTFFLPGPGGGSSGGAGGAGSSSYVSLVGYAAAGGGGGGGTFGYGVYDYNGGVWNQYNGTDGASAGSGNGGTGAARKTTAGHGASGQPGAPGHVLISIYKGDALVKNTSYQALISWLDGRGLGTVPAAAR